MDSDLCCPVCRDLFNDDKKLPRNLGCGHSLCSSCVTKLLRKKPFCPECRRKFSGNQLNDFIINYPLLRLACSARNLEKDLTSGSSSELESSSSQKDVGECTSHGCRLFFWCTLHRVWVCRDCLVLDHQRPPLGPCEIIAAKDATDILKRIQMEKIVAKFKEIEALKSNIEGNMKITEERKIKVNDLRIKFDEWSERITSEVESTLEMYKKHLLNIGSHKTTLNKLKIELDSDMICDNIANMVKNANDMLHNLEKSIDECRKLVEHSSCKTSTQDIAFFKYENKIEITEEAATHNNIDNIGEELVESQHQRQIPAGQEIIDSNLETLQTELMAAHLQIKEFKKQAKAMNDVRKEVSQSKELLNKKSLEIDSFKKELSERSIQQLLMENKMKSLKSERNDLHQKIKIIIEEKVLIQCNHNKDITKIKEMEAKLKDIDKDERRITLTEELTIFKDQVKKSNIEIDALRMQLKESLKHQNSLIKKLKESEKFKKEIVDLKMELKMLVKFKKENNDLKELLRMAQKTWICNHCGLYNSN